MNVAAIVRRARAHAGLSQTELAKRAGTSQPALARYEAGVALPTIPTLERLLRGCGQQLELRACELGGRAARASSVRSQLGPLAQELRRRRRPLLDSAHAHGVR